MSLEDRLRQLKDEFRQQAAQDNQYIAFYNQHYNTSNSFLPLYQLPSRKISDILTYVPPKLIEAAGLVGIAYGILNTDLDAAVLGGGVAFFGLVIDVGLAPLRRIIRGKIISQKQANSVTPTAI